MQERLTEIEIKLAHAEQSLQELSDTVFDQQKHIDRLEQMMRLLTERLKADQDRANSGKPEDEKPPHY